MWNGGVTVGPVTTYRVGYVLEDNAEPLAVFLDSGPDCNPGNLMSYARMGEHGEADVAYVRGRPLAAESQYLSLHSYLLQRYAAGSDPVALVIDQEGVPR